MPTYAINYHQLALRLELAGIQLESDFEPRLSASSREHEEALLQEAEELRGKLDLAVLHWVSEDAFPSLSPRETFFLRLRFLAARNLLYQLQFEDGSSVFRIDGMKEKSFLIWILTRWSHEIGTVEGFDHVASSWDFLDNFKNKKS